jgi:hypothetical protein
MLITAVGIVAFGCMTNSLKYYNLVAELLGFYVM